MKKKLVISFFLIVLFANSKAQNGYHQISVGVEANIPLGKFADIYNTGYGGSLKGLYGVGKAGQVTFTTGISLFNTSIQVTDANGNISQAKERMYLIPFLAGYRHYWDAFYIEPQLGYGLTHIDLKTPSIKSEEHIMSGYWLGGGIGYRLPKGIEAGIRYQKGGANDRITRSSVSFICVNLHYNFNLRKV